jgi:predicted dehydrogenase
VLSEKPFAANAEEAAEACRAGRRAGLVVAEAFHYRYHPVTLRLLEVMSRELGEIQRVELRTTMPAPPEHDARWSFALAGGAMMDLGCYAVHALRSMAPSLGGEPALVRASGAERAGAPGVDEWLEAEFAFPSGVRAFTRADMAAASIEWSWRIVGSTGEAIAPSFVPVVMDDRVIVRTSGGDREEHLGKRPSYAYQLEAFANAVRTGSPLPTACDDPVATMRLIDQCYLAAGFPLRPRLPRIM